MSLFRLLSALTVLALIAGELISHLPSWATTAFAYVWVVVLAASAYDGWRETRRDRAARRERERYGFHRP